MSNRNHKNRKRQLIAGFRWQLSGTTSVRPSSFLVTLVIILSFVTFLSNLHHSARMIRDAELNLPNKTHVIRSISELTTTNALGPNLYLPPQFLHENLRKSTMPQGDSSPTTANLRTMGAFVHIGKTAGSTLSLLLRNGCHSFLPKPCRRIPAPESMASHLVGSYYHGMHSVFFIYFRRIWKY